MALTRILADGLYDQNVVTSKIATGNITGNLIAVNAINASNSIVAQSITGNLIATNSINASNTLTALSITGNLLGLGAISANNFGGGGIQSNVLASNLAISVSRVSEVLNINTAIVGTNSDKGGNVHIDVLNTTVYYFSSNTTGNVTLNLRGNTTTI